MEKTTGHDGKAEKKNKYEEAAKKKGLLSGTATANAKMDVKQTLAATGKDILIGGIGGALLGAILGRSSLLVGAAVTGAGHFTGSPTTAMVGVGMMASGGFQVVSGALSGTPASGVDGIKERLNQFKENLKKQLFLDKLIPKKKEEKKKEKTESKENNSENKQEAVGEVQYFTHPSSETNVSGLDFSEAERIEKQIEQSARDFEKRKGNVNGTDGMDGSFDGMPEGHIM